MYVKNDFIFKPRSDLDFSTPSIDSLFIEVEQEGKNIIVGTIYKSPDTCGKVFNDLIENCLSKIGKENKPCYIVGDFNFDLLNYAVHSDTNSFVTTMRSFSFFPLIS